MTTINRVKIRKAKKQDFLKLAEIMKSEYAKSPYNENWSKHLSLERIKYYNKHFQLFVSQMDGGVVGFISIGIAPSFGGLRGSIEDFVVDSQFQGRGIGKKLFNFAQKYLEKAGVAKIVLLADKNADIFKVYKKNGYNESEWGLLIKALK